MAVKLSNELKKHKINPKDIKWELTPIDALGDVYFITNEQQLRRYEEERAKNVGYFFFIDVYNLKARVCLAYNDIYTTETIFCLPDDYIPGDMVERAINMYGAINISGWYPISKEIADFLKKELK